MSLFTFFILQHFLRVYQEKFRNFFQSHHKIATLLSTYRKDEKIPSECDKLLKKIFEMEKAGNYRRLDKIKYPQNSLRNLARDNVETSLFYLVDIDTVPSANFRSIYEDKIKAQNDLRTELP